MFRRKKHELPPHLDVNFELIREEDIDHDILWQDADDSDLLLNSHRPTVTRRAGLTTLKALELIRQRHEAQQQDSARQGVPHYEYSRHAA